ncbi:hypothetical protein Tco_0799831 [Tanacetum coccineum]|uniref:Uncharacterized protein n=1 Tax=Tanacetum coccineum TaxID=301880 RepID=A0ABQ4ZRF2_9ASTR
MDRMMLEKRKIVEEGEVERIIEDEFPKKLDDSGCFLLPFKVNGTTPLNALSDTRDSLSVMPYKLYKLIGLGKAISANVDLVMVDNYRMSPFWTYGVIIDNGRVTMVIDDNVVKHVNHAKQKGKDVDDEGSDEED